MKKYKVVRSPDFDSYMLFLRKRYPFADILFEQVIVTIMTNSNIINSVSVFSNWCDMFPDASMDFFWDLMDVLTKLNYILPTNDPELFVVNKSIIFINILDIYE